MKIRQIVVSMCSTNCYVVENEAVKRCFVVDPGDSAAKIYKIIEEDDMTCDGIVLTHGHFDHAGAAEELQKLLIDGGRSCDGGTKIYACIHEKETLEQPLINLSGSFGGKPVSYKADAFLVDKEEVNLAGFAITCLFTPGHTPGGCCYYIPAEDILFSGDTLFAESVGRTDFFSGSMKELIRGIKEQLLVLPENTRVLCGHGDTTTIGTELMYNPYL